MKKIDQSNIADYIDFLHQKRKGSPAPQDIKDSWSILSNAQIEMQLEKMYQRWNIEETAARKWHLEFINKRKISFIKKAFFGSLIVAVILIGVVLLPKMSLNNNQIQKEQPFPKTEKLADTDSKINDEVEKQKLVKSEEYMDEMNTHTLNNLLEAEVNQDISAIKSVFATNGVQYWNYKNVSNQKVAKIYLDIWKDISEIQYEHLKHEKLDRNKYKISGYYSYYSHRALGFKSIYFQNIYVFNENGKIIQAYSIK